MNAKDLRRQNVDRRAFLGAVAGVGASLIGLQPRLAVAQQFPNHALRSVHPFSAGSITDTTGRILAERLSQRLGQPVVVENKPGGNTIIGLEYAVRQPADGYTLLMASSDMFGINPNLYKNPGFGPNDLDPLTLVGQLPVVLMGNNGLPFKDFSEIKAQFQRTKEPFTFGTWGVGSFAHVFGEMVRLSTGVEFLYVPFQGAAPTNNALLGNQIDFAVNVGGSADQMINGKRAKGYAVSGSSRLPYLPELPTFAEIGYPEITATQWHGMAVRAGGQQEIIQRLYAEVSAILAEPATQKKILAGGYLKIDGRSPAEFANFIAEDANKWRSVIQKSGIQVDR